jgi:hypothetical protein
MTTQYAKYVKPKLDNDPVFRAKYNEAQLKRLTQMYHENTEYREKSLEQRRISLKEKYDNDPEYRELQKRRALNRYYAKKEALKSPMLQNNVQLVC